MVAQVICHEALDEPVGVIVARMFAQHEALATVCCSIAQGVWVQFALQELIARALIYQYLCWLCVGTHEHARVPRGPCVLVGPEVIGKCLFAPRYVAWAELMARQTRKNHAE